MRRIGVVILLGLFTAGCGARPAHERRDPAPTSAPSGAPLTEYKSPDGALILQIPDGWHASKNTDFVLFLIRDDQPDSALSLDIPSIPPHIPGLIPLGMVTDGYLDDLRKLWPGLKLQTDEPRDIPDAKAHFVHAVWPHHDKVESALLIVKGDHVYILRATGAPDHKELWSAYDQLLASMKWR